MCTPFIRLTVHPRTHTYTHSSHYTIILFLARSHGARLLSARSRQSAFVGPRGNSIHLSLAATVGFETLFHGPTELAYYCLRNVYVTSYIHVHAAAAAAATVAAARSNSSAVVMHLHFVACIDDVCPETRGFSLRTRIMHDDQSPSLTQAESGN